MSLHPHQQFGARWLADRAFAILADEPGAGKTAQVVTACDLIDARKILIVCPVVVRHHWEVEFERWSARDRAIITWDGRPKFIPDDGVDIVSHATFSHKPSIDLLRQGAPYDVIVVDECHELRRYGAARTRALLAPVPPYQTLIPGQDEAGAWSWSRHFWGLTGTPIVNSAGDLWTFAAGPMRDPRFWYDWVSEFAADLKIDQNGGIKATGVKNVAKLCDLFRPVMLRRTLAGIGIQLPQLDINEWNLDVDQAEVDRIMAQLDERMQMKVMDAIAAESDDMESQMSTVRRQLGIAKMPKIAVYIAEQLATAREPIVVFFQHTDVRKGLYEILKNQYGYKVSWIDGKVTRAQLKAAVDWYQAGFIDVLLVQTDAGGMGLTLTRGTRVVFAELSWSAVAQWQAIKRVHRIGQTRPVIADIPRISTSWLEQVLGKVVSAKHRAADLFLSQLETRDTHLH